MTTECEAEPVCLEKFAHINGELVEIKTMVHDLDAYMRNGMSGSVTRLQMHVRGIWAVVAAVGAFAIPVGIVILNKVW
ncbi:MAG: hypothetical protein GY851_00425 [bacterium]|nr:hypothetical protein [bacterium]